MKGLESKPVGECTVQQLMEILSTRCPAIAIGALVPDDSDSCETITLLSGNKMATLGLTQLLNHQALAKATEVVETLPLQVPAEPPKKAPLRGRHDGD